MLIPDVRHTKRDIEAWNSWSVLDRIHGRSSSFARKESIALERIRSFVAEGKSWCAVSWGKDSCVIAHMVQILGLVDVPIVSVKLTPIFNPDCDTVRDKFLTSFPHTYHEIIVDCVRGKTGWHAVSVAESKVPQNVEVGFKQANAVYGDRSIRGIRGAESGTRQMSKMVHGVSTAHSCRPIIDWTGQDVFAYLAKYDIPVHPAYAMSYGGMLDRDRIRVSFLGGSTGSGKGRDEWESTYYSQALSLLW